MGQNKDETVLVKSCFCTCAVDECFLCFAAKKGLLLAENGVGLRWRKITFNVVDDSSLTRSDVSDG